MAGVVAAEDAVDWDVRVLSAAPEPTLLIHMKVPRPPDSAPHQAT
jgi:hypothetical protein